MADESGLEDLVDNKPCDRTASELYMSRCEHKFYMRIVYILIGYIIFSVVCFMFWQFVGSALFTIYARGAVLSAYSSGWSGFSGGMLAVWIIGSIIWAIAGGICYSKGPIYDNP